MKRATCGRYKTGDLPKVARCDSFNLTTTVSLFPLEYHWVVIPSDGQTVAFDHGFQ